jgi:uncharacterized membrane protein
MSNHIDIEYKSFKSKVILFLKGFSMGTADIIPGVSGGTIALISGIYEHLILALSSINPKEILLFLKKIFTRNSNIQTKIPIVFLIVLVSGIASGILSMSRIIPFLMDEYPFYTYSLFFGLILFSVTIPYKKMDHGTIEYILITIFAIFTFILTDIEPYKGFYVQLELNEHTKKVKIDDSGKFQFELPNHLANQITMYIFKDQKTLLSITTIEPDKNISLDLDEISFFMRTKQQKDNIEVKGYISHKTGFSFLGSMAGKYLWIFFVASVAICAMILPGISGAYMLVLFGEYQNILKALYERQLDIIFVFILGIVVGILSFVRLLKYLLQKYHSYTMAALTGFLVGSLNKIYPMKYIGHKPEVKEILLAISIAIGGALLLYLLEKLSSKIGDPEPPV